MASGVKVAEDVKTTILDMKVVKTDAHSEERIRLITFTIQDGEIKIKKIYRMADLEKKNMDTFKFFQKKLKPCKCRYILYDCHFETKETRKEELVFMLWAPDNATMKDKMRYASSKRALATLMSGVKHDLQMNDCADCDLDSFAEKLGKKVVRVEGQELHHCDH